MNTNVIELNKEIKRIKQRLIKKAKETGLYENFGEKEFRELTDKYDIYNPAIAEIVIDFDNWIMDFEV